MIYKIISFFYDQFNWRRFPKIEAWFMDYFYGPYEDDRAYDEIMYCQDCGRMIEWGLKQGDDIIRPAYVTASGDLFCDRCGRAYDEEEERLADEEGFDFLPDEAYMEYDEED